MVIFNDIESLGLWTHRKFIDLAQHASPPEVMQELGYIHIPKTAAPAKYTFERSLKVLVEELKKLDESKSDDDAENALTVMLRARQEV